MQASKQVNRHIHDTFSAHNLLKSDIFFTWLSMKLCPPNPGFTDIINTKSTTVIKKKDNALGNVNSLKPNTLLETAIQV